MVHIQKIIMKKEVDNDEHRNRWGQGQCGVEQSLKMERKMPYMFLPVPSSIPTQLEINTRQRHICLNQEEEPNKKDQPYII